MTVVKALCSEALDRSPASVIYKEARELINLSFGSVNVVHVPRSCNIICAHELARLGLGWDPDQSYVQPDPLPSFVSNLLVRDIAEPHIIE